eukprot:3676783-Alexandrium_andersonii.AAC.1
MGRRNSEPPLVYRCSVYTRPSDLGRRGLLHVRRGRTARGEAPAGEPARGLAVAVSTPAVHARARRLRLSEHALGTASS